MIRYIPVMPAETLVSLIGGDDLKNYLIGITRRNSISVYTSAGVLVEEFDIRSMSTLKLAVENDAPISCDETVAKNHEGGEQA